MYMWNFNIIDIKYMAKGQDKRKAVKKPKKAAIKK